MLDLVLSGSASSSAPSRRHDPRFGDAYRRYRGTVRGALAQLGVAEADRDDLAQEVFVVLLRQLGHLADDGSATGLRAWMYQTARRVAANHRRGQRRRTQKQDALADVLATSSSAERDALADAALFLARVVEDLDEDARTILVLSEVEGRTGPEIASALGINVNTAYSRVRAVRAHLHGSIDRERHAGWLALLPISLRERPSLVGTAFGTLMLAAARITARQLAIGAALLLLLAIPVGLLARGRGQPNGDAPPSPAPTRDSSDRRELAQADDDTDDLPILGRGRIEGRVATVDGVAVPGTRVCIEPRRSRGAPTEPRCVDADADGRYAITGLVADVYALAAGAPGHIEVGDGMPFGLRVAAGQRKSGVDLVLRAGGAAVHGTVVDVTGGPIEGALVRPSAWVTASFARSDAEGRFTLWLDGRASPEVTASAAGYGPGDAPLSFPGENEVEIALTPEAIIEGVVIDEATGDPVANVAVLSRAPLSFLQTIDDVPSAITDDAGRFRLTALGPGRHHPMVRSGEWSGLAARPVLLAIGESHSGVIVTVHPARRVGGNVAMPDGSPCSGARVTARDAIGEDLANTRASGDGDFEIGGLPREPIRLAIVCTHAVKLDLDLDLTASSLVDQSWRMVERPGVHVRGRLVDTDGRALAFATIDVNRSEPLEDGSDASDWGQTDREGRFDLGPVPPGDYGIGVYAEGYDNVPNPGRVQVAEKPVELALQVEASSTLRVRTIDATGKPVRGVDVMYREDGSLRGGYRTSDRNGIAIIEATAGRWLVRAAKPGEAGKPANPESFADALAVDLGETTEIDLVVARRDGVVRGRVVDEDGVAVGDARIVVTTAAEREDWFGEAKRQRITSGWADDAGVFAIDGLEPDSYAFNAATPGGVAGKPVVARPGDDIVVVLPRSGSLCGTVVLDGEAAPRAFEITVSTADERRVTQSFVAADGRWCVEDLARGDATVEAETMAGTATAKAVVPDGGTTEGVELRIVARGQLRARLVDAAGNALRGGHAFVRSKSGGVGTSGDRERQEAGADGVIELSGPAGAVEMVVLAPVGFETRRVEAELKSGALTDVGDIVLEARKR